MKKLMIYLLGFTLIALGTVSAQENVGAGENTQSVEIKTADAQEDQSNLSACCKNKGGSEQCCKKGAADKKTKCADKSANCKNKSGNAGCCKSSCSKTAWWKFWK